MLNFGFALIEGLGPLYILLIGMMFADDAADIFRTDTVLSLGLNSHLRPPRSTEEPSHPVSKAA